MEEKPASYRLLEQELLGIGVPEFGVRRYLRQYEQWWRRRFKAYENESETICEEAEQRKLSSLEEYGAAVEDVSSRLFGAFNSLAQDKLSKIEGILAEARKKCQK